MISIADYKKKYIDKQGKAPAILMNREGDTLSIGDVHTVTNSNGRLKMKWRAEAPDKWVTFTHIALVGNGNDVEYIGEITPTRFEGKARNVEVTFYE